MCNDSRLYCDKPKYNEYLQLNRSEAIAVMVDCEGDFSLILEDLGIYRAASMNKEQAQKVLAMLQAAINACGG